MDPDVQYLLSLRAIRERSQIVWRAAEAGKLTNFDFHPDKLGAVADFVLSVIEVHGHSLLEDLWGPNTEAA